ncbi:MAG: DUF1761 domain-containing protein [Alphaproteobacteria bacterium]
MAFAGINHLAVLVAAIAAFAFGAAYYMILGKAWMAALGKSPEDCKGKGAAAAIPFVVAALAQIVIAYVLAGLMGHLGEAAYSARGGAFTGALVWLGFVLTTMSVNHAFQGAKRSLTLIDGGHWLGVFVVQGLALGLFGI